ncbi:MAG TPA: BlaI/MecI/CopY family transcriptional regulator [Bryobacteraceae bacterium]|nr:BlaI/MecI/CopY family transcriptional regulator [Bryobacteraceae bacterium]
MRKPRAPREIPPPLELECLRALWSMREGNVRQVREALLPARTLAYTTVMTVLERLVRKGAAARHKQGRSFVYAPLLSREVLRRVAVRELVDMLFGGSEQELIGYLQAPQRAAAAAAGSAGPTSSRTVETVVDTPLDAALL